MTKSEIIDRVAELTQDASAAMRQLISSWVNIVLDDVASRGFLNSLQREESAHIATAQRDYDLAEDTDHVFKVFVPAWGEEAILKKITNDHFVEKMTSDGMNQFGRPRYYTIFSNKTLRLHPPADATNAPGTPTIDQKLHVMKYKDIAHLADTADITEIKIKHIPVIIQGAYAFGAKFDSVVDAKDAEANYERGILRIKADQNVELDRARVTPYCEL